MQSRAHHRIVGARDRGRWPRVTALALLLAAASGAAVAGTRGPAGSTESAPKDAQPSTADAIGTDLADLSLEQLLDVRVSTASRFEQRASDAPSAVRVITAEEIRAFGWRTLADALGSLPGLFSSYDRSYTYLGARGFLRPGDYGSRFLLLVDGHRLNEPIYEQATGGYEFPVSVDLIERIEYVPGPGSSVFGSNAFFGVINVITRRGADYDGAQATVEAGSYGHRRVAAHYGRSGAGGDLLIGVGFLDVDGDDLYFPEFDTPEDNHGVAQGRDGERARKFFLKAERGPLTLSLIHSNREKDTPTASYAQRFNDPRSRERDEWSLLGLNYRGQPNATTQTNAHALFGAYDYRGAFVYDYPPVTVNRDVGRARWIGVGGSVVTTAFAGHKLLFGVDAQFDLKRDQYNFDEDPYAEYLADERSGHRAGIFVQDEMALGENLLLNAGLRYDRDSTSGGNVSPRVALIKHWSPDATLKLIYGSAYRSPNAYELYYHAEGDEDGNGSQLANPDLGAERIRAGEIAWSQRFGERTQLQASVYRYRIAGLITQVAANSDAASMDEPLLAEGALVFCNVDQAYASGFELSGDHRWPGGARLRAGYGYARVKDGMGDAPVNSPRHTAGLNLSVPLSGEQLLAGFEVRHVGSRRGDLAPIDAYTVANLTLTWRPAMAWELQGGIRNLFDEHYADPAGPAYVQNAIEQDGRTFLLRATYGF
jgi:outer membrane receptor protein involved in Fe transport